MDTTSRSVTLPEGDWQVLRAALYELPIKVGLATLQRFEVAMAEPQKPVTTMHLVEEANG